jgi:hypothetical protein
VPHSAPPTIARFEISRQANILFSSRALELSTSASREGGEQRKLTIEVHLHTKDGLEILDASFDSSQTVGFCQFTLTPRNLACNLPSVGVYISMAQIFNFS